MTPIPILLDCDPGHDDAIALLLALGSHEVELRGVTTVAGNQTLEKTTANAIRVLELEHLNVEVDCESSLCRGRTVVDVWRRTGRAPNAHVAVDIDAPAFVELLVERVGSL